MGRMGYKSGRNITWTDTHETRLIGAATYLPPIVAEYLPFQDIKCSVTKHLTEHHVHHTIQRIRFRQHEQFLQKVFPASVTEKIIDKKPRGDDVRLSYRFLISNFVFHSVSWPHILTVPQMRPIIIIIQSNNRI